MRKRKWLGIALNTAAVVGTATAFYFSGKKPTCVNRNSWQSFYNVDGCFKKKCDINKIINFKKL